METGFEIATLSAREPLSEADDFYARIFVCIIVMGFGILLKGFDKISRHPRS